MTGDHIECVQVCIERLLCFCGWDVSDGAKKSAVVIPIDPFQRFPFDLAHRFPWADLVYDLCFEQANHAFGKGVVIGVSDGSDREVDLGVGQAFGILDGKVLRSAVTAGVAYCWNVIAVRQRDDCA